MKNLQQVKNLKRLRRKARVRSKIFGTAERPRLSVFRGLKSIYAQLINDEDGQVLASVHSQEIKDVKMKRTEIARKVGARLAKKAINKGIRKVVFDRSAKKFHGRIKAVADGARANGLEF